VWPVCPTDLVPILEHSRIRSKDATNLSSTGGSRCPSEARKVHCSEYTWPCAEFFAELLLSFFRCSCFHCLCHAWDSWDDRGHVGSLVLWTWCYFRCQLVGFGPSQTVWYIPSPSCCLLWHTHCRQDMRHVWTFPYEDADEEYVGMLLEAGPMDLNNLSLDPHSCLNFLHTGSVGGILFVTWLFDETSPAVMEPFISILAPPSVVTYCSKMTDQGLFLDDVWDDSTLNGFDPSLVNSEVHCVQF
jgi:hypothetical protein